MISAESFTGAVFGIVHTDVNPPAAAAAVPVAIVSLCACPGSRKCTCMSMNPGATIKPARVDSFFRTLVELRPNRRDLPIANKNVRGPIDLIRWINHMTATN